MIQRIQTLFLLLTAVAIGAQCFWPVAGFVSKADVQVYELAFNGVVNKATGAVLFSTWWLSALTIIMAVVALVTIFLYKKRIVQVRLTVFNMVLMAGYYALLFWHLWVGKAHLAEIGEVDWYLNISAGFPLVGIVLGFMAIRAILKDEALVRAADRLR